MILYQPGQESEEEEQETEPEPEQEEGSPSNERPGFCLQHPMGNSHMHCAALFRRYYYDAKSGKCKKFVYGGCGGNQNKFGTMAKCVATCKPEVIEENELGATDFPDTFWILDYIRREQDVK